jgi:hypothetical protein
MPTYTAVVHGTQMTFMVDHYARAVQILRALDPNARGPTPIEHPGRCPGCNDTPEEGKQCACWGFS